MLNAACTVADVRRRWRCVRRRGPAGTRRSRGGRRARGSRGSTPARADAREVGQHRVGRRRLDPPGREVEVEDRVDDRGTPGRVVPDDVGEGPGAGVEEGAGGAATGHGDAPGRCSRGRAGRHRRRPGPARRGRGTGRARSGLAAMGHHGIAQRGGAAVVQVALPQAQRDQRRGPPLGAGGVALQDLVVERPPMSCSSRSE